MFVLELLGRLSLRGDTGPVPIPAQQKRPLGLLAILALGGVHGRSRDQIEVYLWPESSGALARHSLDQTVYAIRHALGNDLILSTGRELRLNPDLVEVDVWKFEAAIRARQWEAAVGRYKGALLDGVHLADSRELESWIDAERARLLREYHTALEFLAKIAAETGDHAHSVTWYRRLANSDPLSPHAAKQLMLALAAAGDRAGAVKHARQYQELVRQQLEMEPDSEIEGLASTLIVGTAPRPGPASVVPVAPRNAVRAKRSRIAAVLSVSALLVLLIRADSVPPSLAADTAHRRSRIAVPAARDAYLRGINAWEDRTKEGHDNAVAYFRRATELDPGYAEAYAGLAEAYVRIGYFGYRPADAMFPKAKAAALYGIQLDSTLASAHTALATELIWEHDFAGAESEYREAISLEPANATAHQWHGVLFMILGRVRAAVEEERRAADLEPLSLQIQNNYATFLNISGDHLGALRHFQKTVGEEPDSAWVRRNPWVLSNMARVYADNGQYADAIRMINRALEIVPRNPRALHTLVDIYVAMGRPDLVRQGFERADTTNEQYPAYRGMMYADLGQADSAFFWFDRQDKWGIQPMLSLQADRRFDPMRSDARFRALLARLGIPTREPDEQR
jgi:DNA-binding SARP family transcriptional activator